MTAPKLTPTMLQTLRRIGSGSIERRAGGFWTTPETTDERPGVPTWWVDVRTVRALESRGLLHRMHVFADEWCDDRRLTDAGRRVVEEQR